MAHILLRGEHTPFLNQNIHSFHINIHIGKLHSFELWTSFKSISFLKIQMHKFDAHDLFINTRTHVNSLSLSLYLSLFISLSLSLSLSHSHTRICRHTYIIYLYMYIYESINTFIECTYPYMNDISYMRYPWCNGYRRRKWTRRHEFKSWTRLVAFHIALIPLGKV